MNYTSFQEALISKREKSCGKTVTHASVIVFSLLQYKMKTWAMIVLFLLVAWQVFALYYIHSKNGTTMEYIGWAAWTATGLGIIYALGGFN
jgi:hypothetical protein